VSTITFGEIIPHFLSHLEIKNFDMTSGMDKKELLPSIEELYTFVQGYKNR
jgi:hypothetical protein